MAELGISLLVGLATNLLIGMLTPQQTVEGPRLNDLKKPSSEYGRSIPKIYGRARVTGNLIWAQDIEEQSETSGGKGGGGPKSKTYTYYGTFAMLLSEGEVSLRQLYLDGELVVNIDSDDADTITSSNEFLSNYCEFYPGSADQEIDPTIEAIEGTTKTTAYRGYSYIVFNALPLKDYSNRFPVVSAVVQSVDPDPLYVGSILKNICQDAGIPESYINEANEFLGNLQPQGFLIPQDGEKYKDAIEQLQQFYFFYLLEREELEFRLLTQPPSSITIPINDLGSRDPKTDIKDLYNNKIILNAELPSKISFTFNNQALDYNKDTITIARVTDTNNNHKEIKTELTATRRKAGVAARKMLSQIWIQRSQFEKILLPPKYLNQVFPGSIIKIALADLEIAIQVQEVLTGLNYVLEIKGVLSNQASLEEVEQEELPNTGKSIGSSVVELFALEACIKQEDAEVGAYFGLITTNKSLYGDVYIARNSVNASYFFVTEVGERLIRGVTDINGFYASANHNFIDQISLFSVTLESDEPLNSVTDEEFYNLENVALIGSELVCFQNAVLIGENQYELSKFIRGLRGTETAIATHSGSETFLYLSNLTQTALTIPDIGKTLYLKLFKKGNQLEANDSITFNPVGKGFKPFSPVHPKIRKNIETNDFRISWLYRTPKYGEWENYHETPIEANAIWFEIDIIIAGLDPIRTLKTKAEYVIYKTEDVILDYSTDSPVIIHCIIYQVSFYTGRGYPCECYFSTF